ncbi:MAG: hypothetical protein LWW75_05790 [Chlorobiales bacterium]|nr:hypothetical protein [Chlorobiales bacterium]
MGRPGLADGCRFRLRETERSFSGSRQLLPENMTEDRKTSESGCLETLVSANK